MITKNIMGNLKDRILTLDQAVLSPEQVEEEIRKFEERRKKGEIDVEQKAEQRVEEAPIPSQINQPSTPIQPFIQQTPVQSKKSSYFNKIDLPSYVIFSILFGVFAYSIYEIYHDVRRSKAEEKIKFCSGIEQVTLTQERDLKFYFKQIQNSDSSFNYLNKDTLLEKVYSTNPQLNPNTDFIPGKQINIPVYKQGETK